MSAATTLLERQTDFLRSILDENAPLPSGWGNSQAAGMSVYRGNYRSALIDAIGDTYERTRAYVGDGPFAQVATHHAIAHPPSSWTIDDVGRAFDQTCQELFVNNPEVSELAWLEWTMLRLATAPDIVPMDAVDFAHATVGFTDKDWSSLRLEFQPRAKSREVSANLTALWNAIADEASERPKPLLSQTKGCLVWREGERPTFMLTSADEACAFEIMQRGGAYSEMLAQLAVRQKGGDRLQKAVTRAGEMLGGWLNEGLITRVIA